MTIETLDIKQAGTDVHLKQLESRIDSIAAAGSSSRGVWEELKMRERRETNLIIHNVCESASQDKTECERKDLSGLQKLYNIIGANWEVSEVVKFRRREREKKGDYPRPLKVVLRRKEDRDCILGNAYKLRDAIDEVCLRKKLETQSGGGREGGSLESGREKGATNEYS